MRFSEIGAGTIRFTLLHFKTLIGYAAWPLAPYFLLISVQLFGSPLGRFQPYADTALNAIVLVSLLWISLLLLIYTDSILNKKAISARDLSASANKRFPAFVATAILVALAEISGLMLLIFPAIIFAGWFAFAPAISALTGAWPLRAMGQSMELAKGRLVAVTWRLLLGFFSIFAVYTIATFAIIIPISILTGEITADLSKNAPVWMDIVSTAISTLFIPFGISYMLILLRELMKPKV